MNQRRNRATSACILRNALALAAVLGSANVLAADEPPYALERDGFFYVGGKAVTIGGHSYMAGQMYVEMRIPARRSHPYPIVMVHGGTRSGTTYLGTPDGREGWAQ